MGRETLAGIEALAWIVQLAPVLLGAFVALALLSITARLLRAFLAGLQAGDRPGIESHWGGFGSGLGGWRASASLSLLVATIAFGALFTYSALWIAEQIAKPPDGSPVTVDKPETTPQDPAETEPAPSNGDQNGEDGAPGEDEA